LEMKGRRRRRRVHRGGRGGEGSEGGAMWGERISCGSSGMRQTQMTRCVPQKSVPEEEGEEEEGTEEGEEEGGEEDAAATGKEGEEKRRDVPGWGGGTRSRLQVYRRMSFF